MATEGIALVVRAAAFAADAHTAQRRDDGKTPYFNHLAEVALRCAGAAPDDAILLSACYLHDVLEHTGCTEPLLRERFSDEIADLVVEVSNPPELKGRAKRKHQVEQARHSSHRAKLIKLADKTSNVLEFIDYPAEGDTVHRMARYLRWARRVVDVCRGTGAEMEASFDAAATRLDELIELRSRKEKH